MSRVKRAVSSSTKGVSLRTAGGLAPIGTSSIFGVYAAENYSSAFPSIRAISSDYMQVQPYAIDGSGERVQHDVIDALIHPNRLDSWVSFAEKVAVSTLSLSKTYILVHRRKGKSVLPGGDFTKDRIGGFTFLEFPIVTRRNRVTEYKVGSDVYTDREVLVLPGGVNPVDLYGGYSPSEAARRWITLDDYIADFQKGFFENNAVPAGQFVISAATQPDYEDIVRTLQRRHRGAGNSNNITYVPRPIDSSGNPAPAQIEWIPFAQSNREIGFKDLFEQANRRIDQAYGVAPIIKGTDSTAKYDNASVSEYGFAKRAVNPLLLRNYTQMTHELNRITGGMGIAIAYDYEIPTIPDEERVRAQTEQTRFQTFLLGIKEGFSRSSLVYGLGLPERYLNISEREYQPSVDELDLPEIDDGNEVSNSPDPINDRYRRKQVSFRDFPQLTEDLEIDERAVSDPAFRGCIMAGVESVDVGTMVGDGYESDLIEATEYDRSPLPAQDIPHVTLLFGLLNNGNIWKDKVDTVLDGFSLSNIKVSEVSYFEQPESYVIVAHIERTAELLDAHERLTLLPHIKSFSEYKPHVSLAYIKKDDEALGRWLTSLKSLEGQELAVTGIDYGDLPEDDEDSEGELTDIDDGKKSSNTHNHKSVSAHYTKALADVEEVLTIEEEVFEVIRKYMLIQIEDSIDKTKDLTDDQIEAFRQEMLDTLERASVAEGQAQYQIGLNIVRDAGVVAEAIGYTVSENLRNRYRAYLEDVVLSYTDDTNESIRRVLNVAELEGYTRQQTDEALMNIMQTDQWRVERLGRSELNRSLQNGSLDAMEQLTGETGVQFEKVWNATASDRCEICASLDGMVVGLDDDFMGYGDALQLPDGGIFVNDFVPLQTAQAHPSCRCIITYRVVGVTYSEDTGEVEE